MGNPLGADYTRDQSERNARRISNAFATHLGRGDWAKCHELIADASMDVRPDMRRALAERYARRDPWEAADGECDVLLDSLADEEPVGQTGAIRLAVEGALGAMNLLNGGPSYGPDDEPEDETCETVIDIEPLTTEYAIADLKSRGAA
jgi:hypothetical protein